MIDRETIARVIWDHELRRSGDHDDPYCAWPERGFSDPRTWDYQETADAIIAAIGTCDATGDLLRKMAVSSDGARTTIEIFGLTNDGRFGAKVHRWGTRAVYAYSNTPLAALQAALATVEEAGS